MTKYKKTTLNANKWLGHKDKIDFLKIIQNDTQATVNLGKLYILRLEGDNTEYFEKSIDIFRKSEVLEP